MRSTKSGTRQGRVSADYNYSAPSPVDHSPSPSYTMPLQQGPPGRGGMKPSWLDDGTTIGVGAPQRKTQQKTFAQRHIQTYTQNAGYHHQSPAAQHPAPPQPPKLVLDFSPPVDLHSNFPVLTTPKDQWSMTELMDLQDDLRRLLSESLERKLSLQKALAKIDDFSAQMPISAPSYHSADLMSDGTQQQRKKKVSPPSTATGPSFADISKDLKRREDGYVLPGQPDPKKMKKEVKRQKPLLEEDGEHEYEFGQNMHSSSQPLDPTAGKKSLANFGGAPPILQRGGGRSTANSNLSNFEDDFGDMALPPEDDEEDNDFVLKREHSTQESMQSSFSANGRSAGIGGGSSGVNGSGSVGKLKKKSATIVSTNSGNAKIKKIIEKNKRSAQQAQPQQPKNKDKNATRKKKDATPSDPAPSALTAEESDASEAESDEDIPLEQRKKQQQMNPQQLFWATVNSFFTPLTEDTLMKLTSEMYLREADPIFTIPALGKHYLERWSEEARGKSMQTEEDDFTNLLGFSPYAYSKIEGDESSPLTASCAHLSQISMSQTFPPPDAQSIDILNAELAFQGPTLAQRVLACLVEENLLDVVLSSKEANDGWESSNRGMAAETASAVAASPASLSPASSAHSNFPSSAARKMPDEGQNGGPSKVPSISPFDYNCDLLISLEENLLRELRDIGLPTDCEQFDLKNREDDEVCVELRALHQRLREQVAENNRAKQTIRAIVQEKLIDEAARARQNDQNRKVTEQYNALIHSKKSKKKKPQHTQPSTRRSTAAASSSSTALEKRGGASASPDTFSFTPTGTTAPPSRSGGADGGNFPHPLSGSKQRFMDDSQDGVPPVGAGGGAYDKFSVGKPLTAGGRQRVRSQQPSPDSIATELTTIQEWISNMQESIVRGSLKTGINTNRQRAEEKLKRLQTLSRVGIDVQRDFANNLIYQIQTLIDSNFDPTVLATTGAAAGMGSESMMMDVGDVSSMQDTPSLQYTSQFSDQGTPAQISPEGYTDSQSMYQQPPAYAEEEEEEVIYEEDSEEEETSPQPVGFVGGKQQASAMAPSLSGGKSARMSSSKGLRPRYTQQQSPVDTTQTFADNQSEISQQDTEQYDEYQY